jgi:replicative DNA helicase
MTDFEPPFDADAPGDRTLPHDLAAEQAYLGALLLTPPRDQRRVHQLLAPGDFYRPAHTLIHQAAATLLDHGEPVDPITLTAELQRAGTLLQAGGPVALSRLASSVPGVASSAPAYADRIRALALRRAMIETASRIAARGYDPAIEPADAAEEAVALAREVRDAGRAADDQPVEDMLDFLQHEDTYDWIVPGLIERMDRLLLTGGEGGGKSVLLRQMATCIAAGIHPFTHQPSEYGPARILVLDCENSAAQSRRRYRHMLNVAAAQHMPVKRGQLHIDVRPEGVDLTKATGRAWLMRRVEQVMPDVLVIGPLYQLHAGDPNSEEQARRITLALTEARMTARCALLMEAHAAKANGFGPRGLAPAGSSLWLRWPEFGFGLRPVEDERSADEDRARRLVPWRGTRDDRQFPPFLRQGHGANSWPWITYQPIDWDPITTRSATGATS